MLTRQKSTPQLYFHARTNKVYTLEGTEVRIERPPRNLIIEYQEILQTLPQLSLQQIRLIQSNNAIEYDRNLHTYYTPVLNSDKKFYHNEIKIQKKGNITSKSRPIIQREPRKMSTSKQLIY